jgi:hypothetical protein
MKVLWNFYLRWEYPSKYPLGLTKYCCAALSCATLHGRMVSLFLLVMKLNSCGTPRKFSPRLYEYNGYNSILSAAPIKRTAVERQVNVQIVFLFLILLALSVGSTIGSSIRSWFFSKQQWYLMENVSVGDRGESKYSHDIPNILTAASAVRGFIEGELSYFIHISLALLIITQTFLRL